VFGAVWSELRHRPARAVALLAGIAVAAASFTLLTGEARTSQLQVLHTVGRNFRSAYDILVRPRHSASEIEQTRGLVRANYLSGIYGGITMTQWQTVLKVPGVQVAAPIAMVGYIMPRVMVPVYLTRYLTGTSRQLFRVSETWISDGGLSRAADDPSFVYVTHDRMRPPQTADASATTELTPAGPRQVCTTPAAGNPFGPAMRTQLFCWSLVNGPEGAGWSGGPRGAVGLGVRWTFPLLIAAIDPVQEAKLDHFGAAVTGGRYLTEKDSATPAASDQGAQVPVLMPASPYLDQTLRLSVQRLPTAAADGVAASPTALDSVTAGQRFARLRGTPLERLSIPASAAYARLLTLLRAASPAIVDGLDAYWTPGPVSYRGLPGGALQPLTRRNPPSIWNSSYYGGGEDPPLSNEDVQFRAVTQHAGQTLPSLHAVGVFNPALLPGFGRLSAVPLGSYAAPEASPGDAATRRLLGGHELLPDGNLGGYLQPPPMILTTMRGLAAFTSAGAGPEPGFRGAHTAAPISVIRVRVAGVHGLDALSRERVQTAAQLIRQRTGLDVTITLGSSPTPVTVSLPAGRYGRPALTLREGWVKIGAALGIISAVDRESFAVFALVLLACGLFVGNAAAASARTRHPELGVLACLGWPAERIFAVLLAELGAIGLAGGAVGVLVALAVAHLAGLGVSPALAVLVLPVSVALALAAGLIPAWRAARAVPLHALRPAVSSRPRRPGHGPRGLTGLAAANLARVPGRTAAGAAALAVGVAALTMLVTVTSVFHGTVVGTLLGQAVAVQVHGADEIAVVTAVLLGAAAVADVLWLGIRERAPELAVLAASGWQDGHLARLVVLEGIGTGALGAAAGAVLGLLGALSIGGWAAGLPGVAIAAGLTGLVCAAAASVVPAALLRRLPLAALTAEE
jgi:putative ABC transport system permease protein